MNQHEVIIKGVHMDLTEALKQTVLEKMERLFNHEERIIRVRVELEYHSHKHKDNEFVAKGHIEINGPDIVISVASDDLYKSLDQLVDKLDRKLAQRSQIKRVKRKDTHPIDLPANLPKVRHA
jgi:putative sigma-54 modulation protein